MGQTGKTFAEFFAGIGLVHAGLRQGGWDCAYANDIDPKKCQMYEGEFGTAPYYHVEDVWQTEKIVEKMTRAPYLATASFPCVDLSLAGYWKGFKGEHSSTYFGFLKVIESLGTRRPRVVMLENVYGFLTSHKGKDFETAVQQLAKLGYWIDAIVLDAKWFVPQSRPRVFVFGFHESIRRSLLCRKGTLLDPWQAAMEATAVLRPSVLRDAMDRIELPTGWATLRFEPPTQAQYSLRDVIDLDAGQDWWGHEETFKHYAMMQEPSRKRVDEIVDAKGTAVGTAFRRTRAEKTRTEVRFDMAGCLRTPKGGSAKQIVVAVIKGKIRMRWMSAVEYARLQGAGDFKITVPTTQALYGFGDAVCVPAISWIDRNILTPVYAATAPAEAAA